jgi:Protein of unknown function (DUF1552)
MTSRMKSLDRRCFIKSAGLVLGLPVMESLTNGVFSSAPLVAAEPTPKTSGEDYKMVCIGNLLGFHPPSFFPKTAGANYDYPFLLEPLKPLKKDVSILGGLDHSIGGGHFAVNTFLTGVKPSEAKTMPEGNISIDQRAAETVGGSARFASLTVGSQSGLHGGCMMCWTRSGFRVPPISSAKELFVKLFVNESNEEQVKTKEQFGLKHSILDTLSEEVKTVAKQLSTQDNHKLNEYANSVREVEQKLNRMEVWSKVPKPKANMAMPEKGNMVEQLPLLYDLIILALQSGSTRIATLEIGGDYGTSPFDINEDYHLLSHHGQLETRIKKLITVERRQMDDFAGFLTRMKAISDKNGKSLLDNTMVLFGSGMGNANTHRNSNLPIILAGGGLKHGAFTQHGEGTIDKPAKSKPLSNLYLTMLQRFGVETDHFGPSTGTLSGVV